MPGIVMKKNYLIIGLVIPLLAMIAGGAYFFVMGPPDRKGASGHAAAPPAEKSAEEKTAYLISLERFIANNSAVKVELEVRGPEALTAICNNLIRLQDAMVGVLFQSGEEASSYDAILRRKFNNLFEFDYIEKVHLKEFKPEYVTLKTKSGANLISSKSGRCIIPKNLK